MKTDILDPNGIFYAPARLIIPLFQRQYVWSRELQWQPLWEDIVRLAESLERDKGEEVTHFLGAVVVQDVPSPFGSLATRAVIDGQQRLTTLQLLLAALHGQLARRGWPTLAGQVSALVANPQEFCRSDDDRYKVWPTVKDRPAFNYLFNPATPPDPTKARGASTLVAAYIYFSEAIGEWLDRSDDPEARAGVLVPAITSCLKIAIIYLSASEDAQEIFETLNARGTPLAAAELIKNFVFQQYDGSDEDKEKAYYDYWRRFETPFWEMEISTGRVKHVRSSLFLRQWLIARTLDDIPSGKLFDRFKLYVRANGPVGQLLPRLKEAADLYQNRIERYKKRSGILTRSELFAYRISSFDSEIAQPLLIWLGEPEQAEVPPQVRDELLSTLESWFVRRALVRAPASGSNEFMLQLLKHLASQPKAKIAEAARTFLAADQSSVGYWPRDAEVTEALTDVEAYRRMLRPLLRMVLEAIEDYKRGYPDGKRLALGPTERGVASIEHIMPQEWKANWPATLTSQQVDHREHLIQTLGNLTIVSHALNATISNAPWSQKRTYLENHDTLLLTKDIVASGADGWDEAKIVERTHSLIQQIIAVWPAPANQVTPRAMTPATGGPASTVNVATLVTAGLLTPGTVLRPTQNNWAHRTAEVSRDGMIFVDNKSFKTPSGAARAVTGSNTNGWQFWATDAQPQKTLAELRADYLESLNSIEETVGFPEEDADELDAE